MSKPIVLSEKRDFKGVWIPAELYLNPELSPIEKLLIVEINSLSDYYGECFASNQRLADFIGLSQSRTRHIIANLVDRGYLKTKIIYKKNSKQVEKRILSVGSFTPLSDFSHTPLSENDHTPLSENSHYKNTYISNTDNKNTDIKYEVNFINKSTPLAYQEKIDIHNKETLSATLDELIHIPKGVEGHDFAFILFSSFAQEYKRIRHRKHTQIDCDKLKEYVDKLTTFHANSQNGEFYHTFSIYDYREKDIVAMIDDYFNTKFDDCDYSLHHFMSDGVLATRFWHLEKMLGEEEEEVASI